MAVTNIDPTHHFLKHCKNSQLIRENGQITAVYPWTFELRTASEHYPQEKWLSGQYYEFFEGTKEEKLHACCHFIPIEMKKRDALLRMNVGAIKEQATKRSLRVTHEPEPQSPGYAAIHGMPQKADDELCTLLATLAVSEILEMSSIL